MVFDTERLESLLVKSLETKNEHQFRYILNELKVGPNKKLKCFDGLSTFEKVLITPDSKRFIEICILNGSDFFKKNADGVYPLHYAINSFCTDNLLSVLNPFEVTALCDDHFVSTQYLLIVNEKLNGGNNYLHHLIDQITENNYAEISQMIVAMLLNGCDMNLPNENLETPFYLLLKNPVTDNELINSILDKTKIDFYSNMKDIGMLMKERNLAHRMSHKMDTIVDINYMMQNVAHWDRSQLLRNIELWKRNSKDFDNEMLDLMEVAIVKNLPETVSLLSELGVEINGISKKSKFKLTAAFLACSFGNYEVMKVLLSNPRLSFKSSKLKRNLLHQIFASETVDFNDRQQTFDLIVADERCTLDIINESDSENRVPLQLACQYECDDIVKELLKHGAYIGHKSVINLIKKDTLEEFLDECVQCPSNISDRNCDVYIDYNFLMPPDRKKLEISPVHLISVNSNLQEFILHPVITSFVYLKWKKIDFIVYFNLLFYFGFMIFLGSVVIHSYDLSDDLKIDKEYCNIITDKHKFYFNITQVDLHASDESFMIYLHQHFHIFQNKVRLNDWNKAQNDVELKARTRQKLNNNNNSADYWIAMFGLACLAAYEVGQCFMSVKKYFFKPINWLDISLIVFSIASLNESILSGVIGLKEASAIMILLIGAQSVVLFSKVSAFSMSLHMAILNKVCRTFLKTIAPYLIIISAFGMSFFALNYHDSNQDEANKLIHQAFSNPFTSTITTVRMMLSDFGAIPFESGEYFQGFLFMAFMISISIILLNLLNALAISDTSEMMKVAESVETKKRISTIRTYDTLYSFYNINIANVFPKLTTILLTPNKNRYVKVKRKVKMLDGVTILMQKSGKVSEFEYLQSGWRSLKRDPEPFKFDEKFIHKIVAFVKNRQEKDTLDMNLAMSMKELSAIREHMIEWSAIRENMKELSSIRKAQEDIYRILKKSNQ